MGHEVTIFGQHLFNGLTLGSLYVIIALSITLIFGLTGIVNFAVGEVMMLGAYTSLVAVEAGVPFGLAVLLAVVIMAVAGVLLEVTLFRWTLANPVNGFIVSLGLILVLQALAIEIWGTASRSIAPPFPQTLRVAGIAMGAQNLIVLAVAIIATAAFLFWLYRTKDGRALRAASEDRIAAQLMGVPATRLTAIAFAFGVGMAGLAGGLISSIAVVHPYMSANFLLKGFAVAIMGGLGSIQGAFVAGMLVALIESLAAGYLPAEWTNGYVFGALVLILMVRPGGLFGVHRG